MRVRVCACAWASRLLPCACACVPTWCAAPADYPGQRCAERHHSTRHGRGACCCDAAPAAPTALLCASAYALCTCLLACLLLLVLHARTLPSRCCTADAASRLASSACALSSHCLCAGPACACVVTAACVCAAFACCDGTLSSRHRALPAAQHARPVLGAGGCSRRQQARCGASAHVAAGGGPVETTGKPAPALHVQSADAVVHVPIVQHGPTIPSAFSSQARLQQGAQWFLGRAGWWHNGCAALCEARRAHKPCLRLCANRPRSAR